MNISDSSDDSNPDERPNMSEMNPSRQGESTDPMEEPTGSPSKESNPPSRGMNISDSSDNSNPDEHPNMSEMNPSRQGESTDPMEEPTGGPSKENPSKHAEHKEKKKKSVKRVRVGSQVTATEVAEKASLPPMNLMLFGRKEILRKNIGNIILSQPHSKLNIHSDFLRRQADVCGYTVTLVEVPSLTTMPLSLKMLLKCRHSISQCAPGINAFLLALPGGPFTDEDKEELQMIQTSFGPRVNDYIMILYTNVSCPKVQDSLQEKKHLEQQCHKGCFVLSQEGGHEQISEMLKKIKGKSDKCFTTDMFVEAQIEERVRLQTELEKKNEEMKQLNSSAEERDRLQAELQKKNKEIEEMKQPKSSAGSGKMNE